MPLDLPPDGPLARAGEMASAAPTPASAQKVERRSLRLLMAPLSALQGRRSHSARVALDVGGEGVLAGVLALLNVDLLAARVVDRRRGSADGRVDETGDVLAGVGVARIRDRELIQELLGRRVRVPRVDPDEGDPLAALGGLALQPRHLLAARAAPRRPLVDHDRMAAQIGEAPLEGVGAAWQELIRSVVE